LTGRLLFVAGILGAVVLLWTVARDWDYFSLPAEQRPAHARHADLRSSGRLGLSYGLTAAGLFGLNLSYLVRKRMVRFAWLGTLRSWMAFHVLTGLAAAGLVLLHSAFLPRSALGILASACLGIVVVTGLIGRYIYARVPRSLEGSELELRDLRASLAEERARLSEYGLDAVLPRIHELPRAAKSVVGRLAYAIAGDRAIRREYQRMRAAVRARPELAKHSPQLLPLARRYCRHRQWLARYGELRALMGSWRFLHRWLAIVMIAVLAFHVVIAFRFGGLKLPGVG